ncbi:molybdopterin molybdotransferase MoeA [Streptomyces sp. G-G2]|uniref:molybdopterin molybdotransferase MoeA n=1 Tax=Streptomyces sp. G-G2 TaxID=3046201 RepID=UPI0024B9EE22|nr:molybdopterin molybdotransferase MoeA [Streptomyces sp. G-G2]MDJ0380748.1 molybdopterin molybdotransferase MoeA [Streptomyces sp. G-G2]
MTPSDATDAERALDEALDALTRHSSRPAAASAVAPPPGGPTEEPGGPDQAPEPAAAPLPEQDPVHPGTRPEPEPAGRERRDGRLERDVDEALALVSRSPATAPGTGGHRASGWARAGEIAALAGSHAPVRTHHAPLPDALGEVLVTPLDALTDLPSFDTSAMDGWAVSGPGPWTVRLGGGILAGSDRPKPLGCGEAVRIATGARVPADTTAVIRSEHAHTGADPERLHADRPVVTGQDIRPRAQECRSGDLLLPAGALVTPAVLGLAAAAGYDLLHTRPRPRVEILVLGDELLTEGRPHDGLIRDALSPMLGPWLTQLGARVLGTRKLGDDPDGAEALHRAVTGSTADLIVTTGGTASGPVDHVHSVLARAGAELLVDGVAVRPGHPMLLARLGDRAPGENAVRHLVGLPGNPLAAVSGLLTLAEPLLRALAGRPPRHRYTVPVRDEVPGHPYDTRLVPVLLTPEHAVPLHYNGPAMLRGIAASDALIVVPPGGARAGQELAVLDLPWATGGCFT